MLKDIENMAVPTRRMNAALIVRNEILKLIWRYPEQSISLPTSKQEAEQFDDPSSPPKKIKMAKDVVLSV